MLVKPDDTPTDGDGPQDLSIVIQDATVVRGLGKGNHILIRDSPTLTLVKSSLIGKSHWPFGCRLCDGTGRAALRRPPDPDRLVAPPDLSAQHARRLGNLRSPSTTTSDGAESLLQLMASKRMAVLNTLEACWNRLSRRRTGTHGREPSLGRTRDVSSITCPSMQPHLPTPQRRSTSRACGTRATTTYPARSTTLARLPN